MKKFQMLLALVLTLALGLAVFPAQPGQAADPLPASLQRLYDRTDRAVVENRPGASWVWGPRVQDNQEDYKESPGGKRQVYYFQKGRLEITDPAKNPNDKYYATSGLLLRELITGQQQNGNDTLLDRGPAQVALAGDFVPTNPTYANLGNLVSFDGSAKSNDLTGLPVVRTLAVGGAVSTKPELADQGATHGQYVAQTGHNVAKPFLDFMNRLGTVYENGKYVDNVPVFDPLYVFGLPITEPYWSYVTVGGKAQWVLIQAFERRLLTYTPSNPAAYKVELGNLGLAYVQWRYNTAPNPVATTDPDYARPTETEAFQVYNTVNQNMQSLASVKVDITSKGQKVAEERFQAPDKAYEVSGTTYQGKPARIESIIIGTRFYQRLVTADRAYTWLYIDTPSPYKWPADDNALKPLSLNDWNSQYNIGERVNAAGGDVIRNIAASFLNLDGSTITQSRVVSEKNNVLLNRTLQQVVPNGPTFSNTYAYKEYNVPNNIVAPTNAEPANSVGSDGFDLRQALPLAAATGNRAFDRQVEAGLLGTQVRQAFQDRPTEVLVKFKDADLARSASFSGLQSSQNWLDAPAELPRLFKLDGADLEATLATLRSDPRVEYAEPNYRVHSLFTQFNDPASGDQYYLKAVKMPRAWDFTTGSKGVTVAVIDSGTDLENPDLKGNIAESYNAPNDGSDVSDEEGHGSWTTGIIGAVGNNNVYGAGIAWNSRLLTIKADTEDHPGGFTKADVIKAIRYATDKGARVINMSLGGASRSQAEADVINYATSKGVVIVVAAGNGGDDQPEYPASYPGVISVSATGYLGQPAYFTSFGSRVILAAPGVGICNTGSSGVFACANGTSASAPIVAGAAALVLAVNPALTGSQVKAILIASATPAPGKGVGQRDDKYGYGIVNVAAALRMAATNQTPPLPADLPK